MLWSLTKGHSHQSGESKNGLTVIDYDLMKL